MNPTLPWALLTLLSLNPFISASEWLEWRGPDREGRVLDASWPDALEGHLTEKWNFALHEGYPGPIVTEDRVFTFETKEKKLEIVRALDRASGEELWMHGWEGSMKVPFFASKNGSWVRSTPIFDNHQLYVGGIQDVLVCIDTTKGKEVWRVDFKARYQAPKPSFGMVCSPLIDGDALYVQAGGGIVKLDKRNGTSIWQSFADGGGMNGSAFSSPVIKTIHGKRQLVVQTRTELGGVDLVNGEILWRQAIPAFRGMNILTPLVRGNRLFTSTYGGSTQLWSLNKKFQPSKIWDNKAQGYMSSPVEVDEHVYLHLRNQRMVCINLDQGETTWTSPSSFGKYMSMITNGKKILALDQRGTLYLLKANPRKFEQLDSTKVSNHDTWAHLAIAGNELFVRELKGLRVFTWK
jgi:outer membrane protein assembly factor BamB